MRTVTFIILLFLSTLSCWPQSQRELLQQANKAYNDSDYVKCVNLYQGLLKSDGADSELYYNLGNAYTKLENYGSAVLNYRKALKLKPSDRAAAHNLAYAEQIVSIANEANVEDRNLDPTPKPLPFFSRLRGWIETPGSDFYAWFAGVFFIFVCGAIAVYLFVSSPKWKKVGFFTAIPAFFLSIGCFLLAYSCKKSTLRITDCVLIVPQATLKQSPSQDAKDVAVPLAGGTTFRIMRQATDSEKNRWIDVWLNDDFTGWLPAEYVEKVEI